MINISREKNLPSILRLNAFLMAKAEWLLSALCEHPYAYSCVTVD